MGTIVGLQIGGSIDPDDQVGMHVVMPTQPGVGVRVDINSFDKEVRTISENIPNDHPKAEQLKILVKEILAEKDKPSKLQKIHRLVMTGAGITQIATAVANITKMLGF